MAHAFAQKIVEALPQGVLGVAVHRRHRAKGGRGGRNTEFLLGLALQLHGLPGVWAIAGDTDGIDGSEDNAGALVTPDTLERALAEGVRAAELLDRNDAWGFFAALGDLVVTGPTFTNVNDFRAVLVEPAGTAR